MFNTLKVFLTAVLLTALFNACSMSETTISGGPGEDSVFPVWYNTSGFESDSLAFYGFGEAISDDSTIAAANAELQARANFESHIAEMLEDTRLELADKDNAEVNEADFIITLRNAHQQIQNEADGLKAAAISEDSYYRGFAQVSMSRLEIQALLRSGFVGKESYWNILNSANLFDN